MLEETQMPPLLLISVINRAVRHPARWTREVRAISISQSQIQPPLVHIENGLGNPPRRGQTESEREEWVGVPMPGNLPELGCYDKK